MDLIIKEFVTHMNEEPSEFIQKIKTCPLEELYLIIPSYLTPYLNYVKEHQKLFRTVIENASTLRMDTAYTKMYYHIFSPILKRFGVPEQDQNYLMSFYIHGMNAIITEWLKTDCKDSVEHISSVIQTCVPKKCFRKNIFSYCTPKVFHNIFGVLSFVYMPSFSISIDNIITFG